MKLNNSKRQLISSVGSCILASFLAFMSVHYLSLAMYFATLKKAEMHWIDKKTAHIACAPFFVEMRLKIIAGLLYVTRKFPREICAIIYDYLVITHAPVRPFSQYFNDVYDFTKKEVKDKNLVKFIKRSRIPNIQTMTYTDTISVQIYDDFTF